MQIAISDLRDEAAVYGMLLEENDGYAPCSQKELKRWAAKHDW